MHTHGAGGRRRGKPRQRILYWFRTPPGVRIGRSALDEDAIRLIEEHNPEVEFDWTRILKGQESPDFQQERERRPTPRRDFPPRDPRPAAQPAAAEPSAADAEPVAPAEAEVVDAFLAEPRFEAPIERPQPGDAISVVEARLGHEGLSRLRARYAEVMARVSEAVPDPVRREELKSQADRLNPDTWVTEAEVTAALEAYESVFESLRTVVGRRRRRRRRGGGRAPERSPGESSEGAAAAGPAADELDGQEPGEEQ